MRISVALFRHKLFLPFCFGWNCLLWPRSVCTTVIWAYFFLFVSVLSTWLLQEVKWATTGWQSHPWISCCYFAVPLKLLWIFSKKYLAAEIAWFLIHRFVAVHFYVYYYNWIMSDIRVYFRPTIAMQNLCLRTNSLRNLDMSLFGQLEYKNKWA